LTSLGDVQNSASSTALTAAAARAAHLIVDHEPRIFADPPAEALLGRQADELISYHRHHGDHLVLAGARAQVTIRARVTEELLAAAGVDQYLILGAGLDSFAYRSPQAPTVQVFEVDHPASQADKLERLAAANLEPLTQVRYVAADLEAGGLLDGLRSAGFDPTRPAVVSWLGVTMYLTLEAADQTLGQLAALSPGTHLILDYMLPADRRDETGQAYVDLVSPHSAAQGEPWQGFHTPEEMSELLSRHGFGEVVSRDQEQALPPNLWHRTDALRPARLAMLAHGVLTNRRYT
jgi:methyltransferase (TIGR00027 family)